MEGAISFLIILAASCAMFSGAKVAVIGCFYVVLYNYFGFMFNIIYEHWFAWNGWGVILCSRRSFIMLLDFV